MRLKVYCPLVIAVEGFVDDAQGELTRDSFIIGSSAVQAGRLPFLLETH
jgi:hypothetical protein